MAEPKPQQGWQEAAMAKHGTWMRNGFERLNSAVSVSGIIDAMQGLLAERNASEYYFVFDGAAITTGFPIPVRTRYIVPAFTEGAVVTPPPYPGVAMSEIVGIGVRTLSIQFGLSLQEVEALAARVREAREHDPQWGHDRQPIWWTSSRPVYDMTREKDLDFEECVWWNGSPQDEGIVTATFEAERTGDTSPRNEWQQQQDIAQEGVKNLGEMIDRILQGE